MRAQPWWNILAAVALTGTVAGLIQLTIGLCAVAHCRRRERPIDDPEMAGLLQELCGTMACRRPVALREVPDLTSPATAGRRQPIVLLPDDWRSWSAVERRAVLAHELAHVVRGDYATSLLARVAVVLNYYHPLVRWMAARLQLQQEQAADAMGAHFAGGAARYLVALSSLALRQDQRSRYWPATTFLPARGNLVSRIAMLRKGSPAMPFDQPLLGSKRMLSVMLLLSATIAAATLRGPARGDDGNRSGAANSDVAPTPPHDQASSFAMPFFRGGDDGAFLIRPAAAFRYPAMKQLLPLCQKALDQVLFEVGKQTDGDTSRKGVVKIRCQDVEWLTAGINFDRLTPDVLGNKRRPPSGESDKPLHRLIVGGLAVRMVAPFDWLAFLRQWGLRCEEARPGQRVYYRLTGKLKPVLGVSPSVLLLDDRTIFFDEEKVIQNLAGNNDRAPTGLVHNRDWERASRGLLALAINNHNDTFAKHYDLARADDAVVLSLFKGLDSCTLAIDDANPISLHAEASCRDRDSATAVSRSIDSLIKLGRQSIEQNAPKSPDIGVHDQIFHLLKALATNVQVDHAHNAITVRAQGFGTLADFARIVQGEARESEARAAARASLKTSATSDHAQRR
jgi:beta-lactamase regulating signal transducer with metallopeptidase domain